MECNCNNGKTPFAGTKEQELKLLKSIEELKDTKGALIPLLQAAQDIYGYLPIEVQIMIADALDISLEEVYGVVTFYSQFYLEPKGEITISVCLGTACYVKGSGDIFDKLSDVLGIKDGQTTPDGKYSLQACRCLGACGLAPVMTVNGKVYGNLVVGDVEKILKEYN